MDPDAEVDRTINQNVQTIDTPTHSAATTGTPAVHIPDHSQVRTNPCTSSTTSLTASLVTETLQTSSVDLPADIASDTVDATFPNLTSIPFKSTDTTSDAPVAPPRLTHRGFQFRIQNISIRTNLLIWFVLVTYDFTLISNLRWHLLLISHLIQIFNNERVPHY